MNFISFLTRRFHFKSIDSTQLFLKEHYQKLLNMTFVDALYQTMGRGRNSRTWVSDKNTNLLFSFLIKDDKRVANFASLSILSAVCVKKVLDQIGLKNVSIKWPNDVFVNDKKICGILLQGITNNNKLSAVIIGIGLNVNQESFPANLNINPTSIRNELNKKVKINNIRRLIYHQIRKDFKNINQSNYLKIARNNNYLKNKEVYAELNNEKRLVKVIDINDDNSLKIKCDGRILNITSGEISFHIN